MAIPKAVRVQVWAISDGESTSFDFDLAADPYWIGSATTSGIGGRIMNWFAEAGETGVSMPVDVIIVAGAESATISGTVVTVNVLVKPIGHRYTITLDALFGSTFPILVVDPPVNVDVPYVQGDTSLGGTLTCTMGNWDNMQDEPHSYAYQWWRLDPNTDGETAIEGATDSTYVVVDADDVSFLFCIVTATNVGGSTEVTSNSVEIFFGTVPGGTSGQKVGTNKRR